MSIELKNVTYTYSPGTAYEIHALKDINLSIPDGQFIGIIGHTGSGKSTLIQHFNALIRPTSGTITYNGEDIWGEKYDRRTLRSESPGMEKEKSSSPISRKRSKLRLLDI